MLKIVIKTTKVTRLGLQLIKILIPTVKRRALVQEELWVQISKILNPESDNPKSG